MLAEALEAFGIKQIVTSPGSRNAPLIMGVVRHGAFKVHSVIDERSAAFIALGMASVSGEGVAIICTSGTAMLNYAPAVAEAYYRQIPLIVITADRPADWIDQADGQTMRQPGALANITLGCYALKGELSSAEEMWAANRKINDALTTALHGRRGPVHINVSLAEPLTREKDHTTQLFKKIELITAPSSLPTDMARLLAAELLDKKVLIVAGNLAPDAGLSKAMNTLAQMPNVVIVAEQLANLHCPEAFSNIDILVRRICASHNREAFTPDLLITLGGSLVSVPLKQYLRSVSIREHWHVGLTDNALDTFKALTCRIEFSPEGFFPKIATSMAHFKRVGKTSGSYASLWKEIGGRIGADVTAYFQECEASNNFVWSAPYALVKLLEATPHKYNIQLSNGMTVRYAALAHLPHSHRIDCNRGVSGIDGSVSTAVGAAALYNQPTVLFTGDMSMQYDLSALSSNLVPENMKIVVFNNGGGGIFHQVATTKSLPELSSHINGRMNLPLEELAHAYGFRYAKITDCESLRNALPLYHSQEKTPLIMEVVTDAETDAGELQKLIRNQTEIKQ